ncbi:SDR family NAD(P)-dependent oxidoreductase [Chloroflexota bacterium]
MGRLDGKVAMITGGASGLGKEMAITFAQEGADIVISYLSSDPVNIIDEVKNTGRKVIAVKADVAKKDEVNRLVSEAINTFNKIDILVNNAGGHHDKRAGLLELEEEDWDEVVDANLKGTFLCTQAVAKHMIPRKYGKIVNLSSVAGVNPAPGSGPVFPATKAGIIMLTRACAYELGPYGINVNVIAPGFVPTERSYTRRTPAELEVIIKQREMSSALGRVGTPKDIANLTLFLASDESSFITGQLIVSDGGAGGRRM